jgi:hypothetical protein
MALSLINKCDKMTNINYSPDFNEDMFNYQKKIQNLRLGYIPGVIHHHYHGSKVNRRYIERTKVLIEHKYSPLTQIGYDAVGLIIPTENFSLEFKNDIINYFKERKEDD